MDYSASTGYWGTSSGLMISPPASGSQATRVTVNGGNVEGLHFP
jgi:hypothetical protein